jgi:hypothetical protein
MSFGWSVGDIATAITVLYNLIEALDSCSGAAGEYREAVGFLRNLKRTLDPLQTFTAAWKAYPTYGRDIGEQVAHIKQPIESFLATILKYEPSLGEKAAEGRHRHVLRKLQWYIFISKKVLALRKKIESHMRVIDTLLQRLILLVSLPFSLFWLRLQSCFDNCNSYTKKGCRVYYPDATSPKSPYSFRRYTTTRTDSPTSRKPPTS